MNASLAGRPVPRGIVFDLDGTLVDSRAHLMRYMHELFAFLGRPFPEHQRELFVTLDRRALEAAVFAPGELPRVEAFRRDYPYAKRLHEIVPIAGAAAAVADVAAAGLPRAILTNRGTTTRPLLELLGWGRWFAPVLSAEDVTAPKPAPEGLERIAAQWVCAPTELWFVGDTELDMQCARAAGALAVGVGPQPVAGAELQLDDVADLVGLLAPG